MTELFLKLLGTKVDDAVQVTKMSLAFRGGIGPGWALLAAIALGALI